MEGKKIKDESLKDKIEKEALLNALKNEGKINENTILGVLLKEDKSLKEKIQELKELIKKVKEEYEKKSFEEIKRIAEEKNITFEKKKKERKGLKELKVDDSFIVRIPPAPSKYLHIGHALSFLLNYLYKLKYEKYNSKIILRFEDTNPLLSKQEYVDAIKDDILNYLEIKVDSVTFASDYMEKFYNYAEKLIEKEKAYVCFCDKDEISKNRLEGKECNHRNQTVEENKNYWKKMLNNEYKKGEAILRLKGDMESKNAVMRDPILFRIIEEEHYRQKDKYVVWPTYDFENPILDSLEGITHILRSNEFGNMRVELQDYIKELLGFKKPYVYQYGRFVIKDAETKGRIIKEKIEKGEYLGWDDPRAATLKAMKRRGIVKETFYEIAKEVGLSPTQTTIDWKMIAKYNRIFVDKKAKRFSFIYDEKIIELENFSPVCVRLKYHPDDEKEERKIFVNTNKIMIRKEDEQEYFRLMDLANVKKIKENDKEKYIIESTSIEDFRKKNKEYNNKGRIINWLPYDFKEIVKAEIVMPGEIKKGYIEKNILNMKENDIVQLERFGFCRIDKIIKKEKIEDSKIILWFAHK